MKRGDLDKVVREVLPDSPTLLVLRHTTAFHWRDANSLPDSDWDQATKFLLIYQVRQEAGWNERLHVSLHYEPVWRLADQPYQPGTKKSERYIDVGGPSQQRRGFRHLMPIAIRAVRYGQPPRRIDEMDGLVHIAAATLEVHANSVAHARSLWTYTTDDLERLVTDPRMELPEPATWPEPWPRHL